MTRKKSDTARVAGLNSIPPRAESAEWSEREHIAEPAIVAAQKLLEIAGTPELARQALATVARRKSSRAVRKSS
jgi:hypothetical protein